MPPRADQANTQKPVVLPSEDASLPPSLLPSLQVITRDGKFAAAAGVKHFKKARSKTRLGAESDTPQGRDGRGPAFTNTANAGWKSINDKSVISCQSVSRSGHVVHERFPG